MIGDFYRSKPWINLMQVIRIDRMNDEGEIICEYCGKPITKKYDCIGHHKIELDEENYLDANISLNPDNIMLVHHACHNMIHNKLGIGKKQVFLVYGSPLAGKSTFVHESMSYGDLIVNIDNIWQCVSGMKRYVKPNRLKQNVFAIRNELLDQVKVRRGNWLNAYVIGGYPLSGERERLIKSLDAREVYIESTKEICLERLSRDESRDYNDWRQYIDLWWEQYTPS